MIQLVVGSGEVKKKEKPDCQIGAGGIFVLASVESEGLSSAGPPHKACLDSPWHQQSAVQCNGCVEARTARKIASDGLHGPGACQVSL